MTPFPFFRFGARLASVALACLAPTMWLHGQLDLDTLEVPTATVASVQAGKDDPFAVTNLAVEDIQKQDAAQDVPFLLRLTPSAVVTSDAGHGVGYTALRIRGVDQSRINVTINGVPLNDAESQGVSVERMHHVKRLLNQVFARTMTFLNHHRHNIGPPLIHLRSKRNQYVLQ